MLVCGDARRLPLGDGTVQCVVTSPPYWGLRKYAGEQELVWGGAAGCGHEWATGQRRGMSGGTASAKVQIKGAENYQIVPPSENGTCLKCGAWRGGYGLEPTVEMYVQHTVEVLREVRRVLRDDGVCFWNLGDSYSGSWGNYGGQNRGHGTQRPIPKGSAVPVEAYDGLEGWRPPTTNPGSGLKPKDLCLIPDRVALAAQADGWWVRSKIVWAKPNPMPESVTDRPTDAYEYILMLTKSARYFWDAEAVKEASNSRPEGWEHIPESKAYADSDARDWANTHQKTSNAQSSKSLHRQKGGVYSPNGRNLRNVWTFSELRHYELSDGTVCIVSEDCPVHGQRRQKGIRKTGVGDGRPAAKSRRNVGNDDGHVATLFSEPSASSPHTNEDGRLSSQDSLSLENGNEHEPENSGENRTASFRSSADGAGAQKTFDNECKGAEATSASEVAPSNLDESSDIDRSTSLNKTVSPSSEHGKHGGEILSGIECIGQLPKAGACSCQWIIPQADLANVWKFATQPFSGAHFATFPEELPRRCILAATSAKGACRFCGAPWERVTRKPQPPSEIRNRSEETKMSFHTQSCGGGQKLQDWYDENPGTTLGWRPTCECQGQYGRTVPCVVLDPFGGSGTTGRVAIELGRRPVLLDLAYAHDYAPLARKRTSEVQVGLPL